MYMKTVHVEPESCMLPNSNDAYPMSIEPYSMQMFPSYKNIQQHQWQDENEVSKISSLP